MNMNSVRDWDLEQQRQFWNRWDACHLQEATIGDDARRRGEVALSLVQNCAKREPQILELGCGNGWLAKELCALGTVTGVDLADAAVAEARQRAPRATFCAGDVLSMNLPAASFDIVVTLELFSHVRDQSLLVKKISEWLKKDGSLILMTQNR